MADMKILQLLLNYILKQRTVNYSNLGIYNHLEREFLLTLVSPEFQTN